MTVILSIETSTPVCSVALHREGDLLEVKSIQGVGVHAAKLMEMIGSLLEENKIERNQVSAIAVSEGPGSYTGLRIGASTAKGLAYAWDIPLIAVSTLKAMAKSALSSTAKPSFIIPVLDARRMEIYREVFDSNLMSQLGLDAEVVDENSFSELLDRASVYFVGDAVEKMRSVISHANAHFLDIEISAEPIGALGHLKYLQGDFADIAYFVPNYLKEFKALQSKKNPLLL